MRFFHSMKMSCSALLVLGVGCLAAGGATGCSARSLLDLDLNVDTEELRMAGIGDPIDARLRVEVLQGNRSVREGTSELLLLTAPKVRAGFYLDDNTSGMVTVNITIIDKTGCPIGEQTEKKVTVKPGKATTVTVTITITRPSCPTEPDAGVPMPGDKDSGAPDPGTPGQDASPDAEESPADASDGGPDVYCPPETGDEPLLPPSCEVFCRDAGKKCPQNYPTQDDCVGVCKTWPVGELSSPGRMQSMSENTLGCRASWLRSTVGTETQFICMAVAEKSLFCTR
jgi:hypothetical protein